MNNFTLFAASIALVVAWAGAVGLATVFFATI